MAASDRGDRVGRAIVRPLSSNVFPDTTSYRHRDDALVCIWIFNAGIPQRVEDSLGILLMHNQIVGDASRGNHWRRVASCRVTTRPVAHGPVLSRHTGQLGGPYTLTANAGIDRSAVHRVDSGGQRFAFGGETVLVPAPDGQRSTSRGGALLRRISVPPDTPCVAASSPRQRSTLRGH